MVLARARSGLLLVMVVAGCGTREGVLRDKGTVDSGSGGNSGLAGEGATGTGGASDASLTASEDAARDSFSLDAVPAWCEGGAPALTDSGSAPPEHCFAPCVWDLMKNCQPLGPCTVQDYGINSYGGEKYVSCALMNRWWEIQSPDYLVQSEQFYLNECHCYGFTSFQLANDPSGITYAEWTNGRGAVVAWGNRQFATTTWDVICGSTPATNAAHYYVDPSLPDCQPWASPICSAGICPGNPPALP